MQNRSMANKIAASALDIIAGLTALIVIDVFSRCIHFDYVSCTIITAAAFLIVGMLRGGGRGTPVALKVLFINIGTLFSFAIVPLPIALYLPIPLVAVVFASIGLLVRSNWVAARRARYAAAAVISFVLVSVLSIALYPRYISNRNTRTLDKPAVEFEFKSFAGDAVRSGDIKGNVIVLDFWDSRCGPCLAAMPSLETLQSRFKNRPGVKILCVDVGWNPLEKERAFTQRKGYDLPFAYDEKGMNEKALGFGGAGFLIIIDKKFTIRLQHIGFDPAEDFVGSLSGHIEQYLSEP